MAAAAATATGNRLLHPQPHLVATITPTTVALIESVGSDAPADDVATELTDTVAVTLPNTGCHRVCLYMYVYRSNYYIHTYIINHHFTVDLT